MARAGAFDDLDAALNFHPASINHPSKGENVGVISLFYRFFGRTAHAGGAPHEGRSALDAVELMNVGVNYLREHVKDDVRMHYIITDGGKIIRIGVQNISVIGRNTKGVRLISVDKDERVMGVTRLVERLKTETDQ